MLAFKEKYTRELKEDLQELKDSLCRGSQETLSEVKYLKGQILVLERVLVHFDHTWNAFFSDKEDL